MTIFFQNVDNGGMPTPTITDGQHEQYQRRPTKTTFISSQLSIARRTAQIHHGRHFATIQPNSAATKTLVP